MELDFDNDEFESFLKTKADQYKMYPSERCWKGISFVLHSRSRWITIGSSLLLISTFFFFGGPLLNSKTTATNSRLAEPEKVITQISGSRSTPLLPVSPENIRESVAVAAEVVSHGQDWLSYPSVQPKAFRSPAPVLSEADFEEEKILIEETSVDDNGGIGVNPVIEKAAISEDDRIGSPEALRSATPNGNGINAIIEESNRNLALSKVGSLPPVIPYEEASEKSVNWLQEIAAIKLTAPKKQRFNLQFYFSPTVSYRRLVDNTGFKAAAAVNNFQNNSSVTSINRFVDHKPSIGVEVGSNVLYKVGRSLTLKTGLQLNYSRYTIKAYKSFTEKAAIALNSVGMHAPDTIVTYTNVRNFNGYSPEQLENQYLQVSVPVAAELLVIGGKHLQFSIAGTVQPSYLIFNDAYLLSTDYQHYAKEPSLVRKWNVHTSAEAFVSYKSGSLRWQVGPQFRYQLMSTYNERYPIKEYLMEYGVKFGVSKTLK